MTHTIGFIGLGMMGMPMATRLAGAGHRLRVADTAPAAVQRFLHANPGATHAAGLADFAGAGVVSTMLPSSDAVDSVVRGTAGSPGLSSILAPDSVLIDMSSSEGHRAGLAGDRFGRGNVARQILFLAVVQPHSHQLEVADDTREQVVEVVRDAARQLPDRFHLAALAHRLFGLFAPRHRPLEVAGDCLPARGRDPLLVRLAHYRNAAERLWGTSPLRHLYAAGPPPPGGAWARHVSSTMTWLAFAQTN